MEGVENGDGADAIMNSANTSFSRQSSVILICSNGIGTKWLMSIPRERSSGSVCGGTSLWMRSGRTDNSIFVRQGSIHRTKRSRADEESGTDPLV